MITAYENGYDYRNSSFSGFIIDDSTSEVLWTTKRGGHMYGQGHASKSPISSCSNLRPNGRKGILTGSDGTDYIYVKKQTPHGSLVILKDRGAERDSLNYVYFFTGLIFLSGILVSIPMGIILGKKFTKPLVSLTNCAEAISKGDYSYTPKENYVHDDELHDLSLSMKNMRNQLVEKDKFQKEFIANVSHDLKTPLSIIRNSNEAIWDGLLDEDGCRDYANKSIIQVDRLNSMVNDIMNLSKLQSDSIKLNRSWIFIKDLSASLENDISSLCREKHINHTILENPFVSGMRISVDVPLIRRCILNFVTNAVKVTPSGGDITLCFDGVMNHGSLNLKFWIKDSGTGISSEILDTLWDRYTKASQSGGMGLGLSINKEILLKHGFTYSVENSKLGGAVFSFHVPDEFLR